jgi:hypothetical protein
VRDDVKSAFWNAVMACVFLAALLLVVGVHWYRSAVQAEVYHRQGVEMTTWEVFVGAKPAERTINIKDGAR